MPVRFNGPDGIEELVPAPLVEIQKTYQRDEGDEKLFSEYVFTLNGTIVNVGTALDSPDADDDGMEGILAEKARIRNLFSRDWGRLEIESPNGGGPNTIDAYCKVESIDFRQGTWVNRCDYTIVLRSVKIEGDDSEITPLTNKSETWAVNENEDGTYAINHQLSATGKLYYNASGANNPLEEARYWCRQRAYSTSVSGILSLISSSGVDSLDLTHLIKAVPSDNTNFWNRATVENVGTTNYSWQLTENFIYNPSGNFREEFSAVLNYEPENPRRVNVSANGSVFGYSANASDTILRLVNAKNHFNNVVEPNLYGRLYAYVPSGYTLNPVHTAKQVTFEERAGLVQYTTAFTAVSGNLIDNSIEENISIVDSAPTDIFAQIPVPGRINGPVVQFMETTTLPERTVVISASLVPSNSALTASSLNSLYLSKPNTNAIVNALKPSAGYFYIKQDTEEWNPIKRQYNRSVSWALQPEGLSVSGIPTVINNTP